MTENHNQSDSFWQRVQQIFDSAVELPAEEHTAHLKNLCGNDEKLRMEVESLLYHHTHADTDFMKVSDNNNELPDQNISKVDVLIGKQIGGYKILRRIGAGGMGAVYEAEQLQPRRKVAIKTLRPDLIEQSARQRFNHEAQLLSHLDHVAIARIYEAGVFDAPYGDQPFFAMEYIEGKPLIEYIKNESLGLHDKLKIMATIAEAIHHAHLRGVIHRDLKPGNILITDSGRPKILDFGVARTTNTDIQITSMQTSVGQIIGTLPYMSPEQATGDPATIDFQSDVYALGVLMYEILADRMPYDVSRKLIHEALRMIQEDEPAPLSSIDKVFRGDLDVIVNKALQKDKARRYASAGDFAADIRRYLNNEPIVARPATTWYQVSKFARRNKVVALSILSVCIALSAGLIITSIALIQTAEAKNAEAEQRLIAQQKQLAAEEQEKISRAVMGFLGDDLLASVAPDKAGKDVRVREILDSASKKLEKIFGDAPKAKAYLHTIIGNSYLSLGEYDEAKPHLEQALSIREKVLGDEHSDTMNSLNNLGSLYFMLIDYKEAEKYYRKALTLRRRILGNEHLETIASVNNLAAVNRNLGRYAEAVRLMKKNYDITKELLGKEAPLTLVTMTNLAGVYGNLGRNTEAEKLYKDALDIYHNTLGDDHPSTSDCMYEFARFQLNRQSLRGG